jgi:hypothetical protein
MVHVKSAFSAIFHPPINYAALVLVEPVILSPELFWGPENSLGAQAAKRRDIWPSKKPCSCLHKDQAHVSRME